MKTPGKYIEVYELDGMFPKAWLMGDGEKPSQADLDTYTQQLHIITFYKDSEGQKQGIVLFEGKGDTEKYKFIARDKIFGRALGMGGIEELFEAQVWTNYAMIRLQGMLDAASKVILQTADAATASRNKTTELENGEILFNNGKPIESVDTRPLNASLFDQAIGQWGQHAQDIGSAGDALLGVKAASGTPFALQQLNAQQANNLHEYRRGKLASFLGDIYRDWILPDLVKEMNNEQEFMEELSLDEMSSVAEAVANFEANKMIKERVIAGQPLDPKMIESFKQQVQAQFMKGGNKKFFGLLKNELKTLPVDVDVNIAGKQKDLAGMTDKLVNVFRMVVANPSVLSIPAMAKTFNRILEASGLDSVDFSPANMQMPPSGPNNKVMESINFKDLPPDGQAQLAKMAGIDLAPQGLSTGEPVAAAA